ncbi:MAG TPA: exodeoxyribonuclease VII small subunit [Clostridia bacterium]|jgi:exodeoxyribonuclease VII small subunit|nr:exodeoxyribonuclease VII small subunit [Clostridia bacterium]
MNYEKNIKELEGILQKLSDEKLSLDESLKLYAMGVELARASLEELNNFKGKMEVLDKQLKELEITDEDDE